MKRYFTDYLCTQFSNNDQNLDTCIRLHTNKLALVYLSIQHDIISKGQRIKNVNFQVKNNIDRLKIQMSGKGKRGAQFLVPESVLCEITTENGEMYAVRAGIFGKLLEVNSEVVKNPNLLIDEQSDLGWLVLICQDLSKSEKNISLLVKCEKKEEDLYEEVNKELLKLKAENKLEIPPEAIEDSENEN